MTKQQGQVQGLPSGWTWSYGKGRYFSGRHAVNILSGQEIPYRTVTEIRQGKLTLDQALHRYYESEDYQHYGTQQGYDHDVFIYRTLDQLYEKVRQFSVIAPGDLLLIKGYGVPKDKGYLEKGKSRSWLSILPYGNAAYVLAHWQELEQRFQELFHIDGNFRVAVDHRYTA